MDDTPTEEISSCYRSFATNEARGRSSLYELLADGIAGDAVTLSFLAELPRPKRQPNLLLAAIKFLFGAPQDWDGFRNTMEHHSEEVRAIMMSKSTQTNEPARCATLMPLFASLPQPLALLEVGTAAGLCLLPDRYSYDYGGYRIEASSTVGVAAPIFRCQANRTTFPVSRVEIAWRAGIDLNPIDVNDDEQVAWLEALVWPGEEGRLDLLRAALAVARQDPPRIVRGDLRRDLPSLVEEAPEAATLVVFHTSVLCYVPNLEREEFAKVVRELGTTWISNEGAGVLPWIAEKAEKPWRSDRLLLALDEAPMAWTDPHGKSIEWLGPGPSMIQFKEPGL